MGRQVIVNLTDVIDAGIKVVVYTVKDFSEGDTGICTTVYAELHYEFQGESRVYVMDYSNGLLSSDFNLWGSNFAPLTKLFHEYGIPYRVD